MNKIKHLMAIVIASLCCTASLHAADGAEETVPAVASIAAADGSATTYADLQSAFDAAVDGVETTITLLDNVTAANVITNDAGKNVVLELGAFTLSSSVSARAIMNNGSLTINATTGGIKSTVTTSNGLIDSYGTLVINGGTFTDIGAQGRFLLLNRESAPSATINGGVFKTTASSSANGLIHSMSSIKITGGTFTSKASFYSIQFQKGVAVIEPSSDDSVSITSPKGVAIKNSDVTINGGSITTTTAKSTYTFYCEANGSLQVNGGIFKTAKNLIYIVDGTSNVQIAGGTFSYAGSSGSLLLGTTANASITGGTFVKLDPSKGLAANAAAVNDGNNTYTVIEYVAELNGTKYETLEVALNAAAEGDTVTVLSKNAVFPATLPTTVTIVLGEGATAPAAPEGYEWEEGTLVVALPPVASVTAADGTVTTYKTLLAAVDAAKAGETITLVSDYTIPEAKESKTPYVLPEGGVLDLGGFTLTVPYATMFCKGVNATIANGFVTSTADYSLFIAGDETVLTVANVKISGGINVLEGATAILKDSQAKAPKKYYAVYAAANTTVKIESGTYTGGTKNIDVYAATEATIAISGGTFTKKAVSESHCALGYVPMTNEDGTYGVKKIEPKVTVAETTGGNNVTMETEDGSPVEVGSVVTLKTTVQDGYTFVGWTEGGEIVSTDVEAQMTIPAKENVAVTANFIPTAVYESITNQAVAAYEKTHVSLETIKKISAQNPTVAVSTDENNQAVADVGIQLMCATSLGARAGEQGWAPVTKDDQIETYFDEATQTIRVKISADEKTRFFKFVPKNGLGD